MISRASVSSNTGDAHIGLQETQLLFHETHLTPLWVGEGGLQKPPRSFFSTAYLMLKIGSPKAMLFLTSIAHPNANLK